MEAAANPPSPFGTNPWPLLLPEPDGAPLFTLQRVDLHVRDPEFDEFWHDFRVLVELLTELPDGGPHFARLCAGLDRACNLLELPDISDSWRRAQPVLVELLAERAAPGAHRVSMVGHAHLDTAWLWPLRETIRKCARTFSTVLELMDRYPEYRFVVSQAQHLAWMRDHYPDLWERMKERIAEGRLEPTGSMWVESDCNIPSGESLVRQIFYGKQFYRREFGIETEDVWLPDVFGYSAALPQIMQRSGIRWFLTQKLSWNQYNVLPHHSFLWEGIDGSRVFTHFPPADTYNGNVSARELRFGVENFKDHDRATRSLYLFGWGDGGGGPTAEMLESARRLADIDGIPRLTMESARSFFTEAEAEIGDPAVWVGELYLEYHRGTYTSQAATKLGNRRAEFALRDSELWTSLAPAARLPGRRARRTVEAPPPPPVPRHHPRIGHPLGLRGHRPRPRPHPGRDAAPDGRRPRPCWSTPSTRPAVPHPVVAFNSLSHARRRADPVEAPDGDHARWSTPPGRPARSSATHDGRVLFEASVPACGYQVYDLVASDPATGAAPGDGHARRRSRTSTCASSSTTTACCRRSSTSRPARQVLAPGATGQPLPAPSRLPQLLRRLGHRPVRLRPGRSISTRSSRSRWWSPGPCGPASGSPARSATPSSPRSSGSTPAHASIEFDTEVEWHETNRLLKVAFPVDVRSLRATYEIQYGHVERPTHANTSWDVARFEVCAHKWVDLSEPGYGVALLNDSQVRLRHRRQRHPALAAARPDLARPGGRPRPSPLHATACSPTPATSARPGSSTPGTTSTCPSGPSPPRRTPGTLGTRRLAALGRCRPRRGRGGQACRRPTRRAGGPALRGVGTARPGHRAGTVESSVGPPAPTSWSGSWASWPSTATRSPSTSPRSRSSRCCSNRPTA